MIICSRVSVGKLLENSFNFDAAAARTSASGSFNKEQ
jgi:hypothetical protein